MDALFLGLLAALLWGLHDFTARLVGPRTDALVLLAGVLATGVLVLAPIAMTSGQALPEGRDLLLALLAGISYTCAGLGLYKALTIGPVHLVAPICGAYPMISVAFAVARGSEVGALSWGATALVLLGIALVARSDGHETAGGSRMAAIGWAVISCFGFALTFALSQWASESGAPLQVALVARITAALVTVAAILALRPAVAPTARSWRPMVLMGLLDVVALTTVTLTGGLRNAEYAAVAASVFGVITILLAWRFLNERLGPVQWLGCGLVFCGIATLGLAGHGGHG